MAAGVEREPRVIGVRDGLPVLEDDRVLEVANVVWCTGFRTDFRWIDLPVFDDDGRRCTTVESSSPSLVCTSSGSLPVLVLVRCASGRGRDAKYIANHIGARRPRFQPTKHVLAQASGGFSRRSA